MSSERHVCLGADRCPQCLDTEDRCIYCLGPIDENDVCTDMACEGSYRRPTSLNRFGGRNW